MTVEFATRFPPPLENAPRFPHSHRLYYYYGEDGEGFMNHVRGL